MAEIRARYWWTRSCTREVAPGEERRARMSAMLDSPAESRACTSAPFDSPAEIVAALVLRGSVTAAMSGCPAWVAQPGSWIPSKAAKQRPGAAVRACLLAVGSRPPGLDELLLPARRNGVVMAELHGVSALTSCEGFQPELIFRDFS